MTLDLADTSGDWDEWAVTMGDCGSTGTGAGNIFSSSPRLSLGRRWNHSRG